jgi:para-nitrobenzyl esterase
MKALEAPNPRAQRISRYFSAVLLAAAAIDGAAYAQSTPAKSPVVRIDSGRVRGLEGDGVISFRGIPYAAPPVGKLRWREPQPAQHWSGVRDTTKFGPECMQTTDEVPKSEDCLTLNVLRPASSARQLPVMVWIYGGANVHGQTSLYPSGEALAKLGVVFVSMNYRMGRLGFFAHPALLAEPPDELHGDYGHMDQRSALQWVQRNIAAFGGNPKAVTIFGESSGGGSVLVHLTSPLSRGLFQRAIMQSPGSPASRAKVFSLTELSDAEKMAIDYARSLGITGEGPEALAALRALPAEKLVEGTDHEAALAALAAGQHIIGVAGSIRDGKLVVEAPEIALAAGREAKVPVMIGANDRDLALGAAPDKDELFAIFGANAVQARKLYDPQGDQTLDELKQQVYSDRSETEPARHLADEIARAGHPAYLYRFSYVAESTRDKTKGVLHGLEIPYVFNIPAELVGDKVTADDKKMAELASAYWVSFARTGDPNGGNRPQWRRHDPAVDKVIDFTNNGVVVGPDPLKARLDLWRKVWSQDQ